MCWTEWKGDECTAFLALIFGSEWTVSQSLTIFSYVEEGLSNSQIQKVKARIGFWEIIQSAFCQIICRTFPQEIVSNMVMHGDSNPCLSTYWRVSNKQPSLNLISRSMITFASSEVKVWCGSTWRASQSGEVLNFGFIVDHIRGIYISLTCTWEIKETISLGQPVALLLCKSLKVTNSYLHFDSFFTSLRLIAMLLGMASIE